MTPTLYAKLSAQVARQQPELAALDADISAAQPAIDSAQAWHDSCAAAHESAQAALDAARARPDDAPEDWTEPDASAQQAAVAATAATLETARADLAALTGPRDELVRRAEAIRAAIAQCQSEMTASGLSLTQGEIDAILNAPKVPEKVTMRQARLALLGAGLLPSVDAAIDSLPEPTKSAARIEWEYSGEVWRDKALVQALAPALGLTDAQLDQLFITAATL